MFSDGTLNVVIAGEGEPTILFVHGFGCSLEDWEGQVKALSSRFRCVSLDLPGHGASAPSAVATVAAMASAVNAAKKHTVGDRVILVGHSLGAKVIREAYCQSQDDVIGLILIDGRYVDGDHLEVMRQTRETIDKMGFDSFARSNFNQMLLEGTPRDARERIVARALRLDSEFGRELFVDAVAWDALRSEATLKQIAVPLLLLQSTHTDGHGKRASMQPGVVTPLMTLVAQLVPNAESKAIARAGHFAMLDVPDLITREIANFAVKVCG